MLTQKLRRSGNSYVVTIPPEEVERLGLHEGDLVGVEVRRLQVRPELTPELRESAEASWRQFKRLYRRLADA